MTVALGVLLASLLGSVHCAAMCGAFVCAYAVPGSGVAGRTGSAARAHASYNAGRLVSYLLLGAVAGTMGGAIDAAAASAGLSRGAAVVAGLLMVAWALATLATRYGARTPSFAPEWATRLLGGVLVRAQSMPPAYRAGTLGALTTLLPCGWLYAFVAVAGGTGSAPAGMLVMAAFWVGTLPALVVVGITARRAFGPFTRRLPALSATVVLVLGALTVAGKMNFPRGTAAVHSSAAAHGH